MPHHAERGASVRPVDLAGLSGGALPDSPVVLQAIELARDCAEPWLFNHSMRSWLFSTHIASIKGWRYDP
jgi:hypothetical protein